MIPPFCEGGFEGFQMSLRLGTVLLLLPLLFACVSPPAVHRITSEDRSPEIRYRSRVFDADAKALFRYGQAMLLVQDGDVEGAVAALRKAVELDPDSALLKITFARGLLELQQEEEALRVLEDALIDDPGSLEARLLLGELLSGRDQLAAAANHFREVLRQDPDHEEATLQLVGVLARGGDPVGGIELIKGFLDRKPDSLKARVTLARLYREIDLTTSAEEAYRKVLALHPGLDVAYIEMAGMYEAKGDKKSLARALKIYREALKAGPMNFGIRHHLVRLLVGSGDLPGALRELEKIRQLNPGDGEALRKIGLIHLEQERFAEAAAAFRQLLLEGGEDPQVRFYLGSALERMESHRDALREFLKIPADSPLYLDARVHVAYLHQRLGELDEAIAALSLLLKKEQGSADLYAYLAALWEEKGEFSRALQVYQQGMLAFEGNTKLMFRRGMLLERMGMSAEAQVAVSELLAVDPNHAEGLNFLAYTYAEAGIRLEEALSLVEKALEVKEEGHILDTLGWVYFRMGRFEEARDALERAVALLPSDPVVLEHLGDAFRALEQPIRAAEFYRKALEAKPGAAGVQEKLEGLGR